MMELLPGVALLILAIAIISVALPRLRERSLVHANLHEEREEHLKVMETGSNFRTRMSDYKADVGKLRSEMDRRGAILESMRGVGHGGEHGVDAEEARGGKEGS